jgi:hypothetical protein
VAPPCAIRIECCAAGGAPCVTSFWSRRADLGSPAIRALIDQARDQADGAWPPRGRRNVGQQALFAINLEPRKMAGELSEGMLFDIGHADGLIPVLAVPESPLPDGARAG